jgi:hypothetical protein
VGAGVPINRSMAPSTSSPRLTELVESSAARLTVLLGALKTLQVPDPRLSPVVLNEILHSAVRQATELEGLVESVLEESRAGT